MIRRILIASAAIVWQLSALILAPSIAFASDGANLLSNGPPLTLANPAGSPAQRGPEQIIALKPEWGKLLVRASIRVTRMVKSGGASGGQAGAVVDLTWRMKATGKRVTIESFHWQDATNGWADMNEPLDIPSGADQLIVAPEIAGATGSADFRDLSVVAWVTTFDDEFDGSTLDTTRWTPTDSDHILYAPGAQYFAPDHIFVKDGIARFHADNTSHNGYQWQSAEIRTADKFQQLYGYWEFRLRIPVTEGTWPAVYLLKWDDAWPPEIDLMESTGKIMQTVFEWNHNADDYGRRITSNCNFARGDMDRTAWHTYAVCWEPGALAWYVDNIYRGTTKEPDAPIPEVPMYIRFNLAVAGWGGDPSKTPWPANMDCDYVHVYQRCDMPLPLYTEPSIEITLPTNRVTLRAIGCNPLMNATAKWTLAEGPAGATIQNPNMLTTTATIEKPGMYRFNVRVVKGSSEASRDLLVYINPAPRHP